MKRVIVFGSTGSIGLNTLAVLKNLKDFQVTGLAAFSNYRLLIQQAREYGAENVCIIGERYYDEVCKNLRGVNVFCGESGLLELVKHAHANILVAAFSSAIGIYSIIEAIRRHMRICLATKEILVSFGEIVMKEIRKNKAELIPVDSEHSAVYQCLEGKAKKDVEKIILTASGGPFLNKSIKNVRKEDVLKHPVWNMGKKITVDSATMMNKALEIIEAYYLFGIPPERIKVVVHPEAICHSLVQFVDGTMIGQFSKPDMRLPIQYALTTPERRFSLVKPITLEKIKQLNFLRPDSRKFPGMNFAYWALKTGKSMPAVLNGANEAAVHRFLSGTMRFRDIPYAIKRAMENHKPRHGGIEDYLRAELWARQFVYDMKRL